jgi:hypothetical protein
MAEGKQNKERRAQDLYTACHDTRGSSFNHFTAWCSAFSNCIRSSAELKPMEANGITDWRKQKFNRLLKGLLHFAALSLEAVAFILMTFL